jgi:DNA-binding MarR family transcriptional regulator
MMADTQDIAGTESASSAGETGYLLWHVVNLWQRRQKEALAPFDLTPVQYLLLAGLSALRASERQPVNQSKLARHCRTDPMMTSQVLRTLERAGLVARRLDTGDGRAVGVTLTEKGLHRQREARPAVADVERGFFAALGPDVPAFGDALTVLSGRRPRRRVRAVRG